MRSAGWYHYLNEDENATGPNEVLQLLVDSRRFRSHQSGACAGPIVDQSRSHCSTPDCEYRQPRSSCPFVSERPSYFMCLLRDQGWTTDIAKKVLHSRCRYFSKPGQGRTSVAQQNSRGQSASWRRHDAQGESLMRQMHDRSCQKESATEASESWRSRLARHGYSRFDTEIGFAQWHLFVLHHSGFIICGATQAGSSVPPPFPCRGTMNVEL